MEAAKRRRRTSRITLGQGPGIRVWLEPSAPGIQFEVDDEGSPVRIRGTWEVQEERMLLVDLCVSGRRWDVRRGLSALGRLPEPLPPVHVSSTSLRSVSVPALERRTREAIREQALREDDAERYLAEARRHGYDVEGLIERPRVARGVLARIGSERLRPGRNGYPLSLYRWVAAEYLSLLRAGGRPILRQLAEKATARLGRLVTEQNARDWVHRARELGLLSAGVQGKAHGQAGPALRRASGVVSG